MELIIESGATKTDFCLSDGQERARYRTSGINLATMDMSTVSLRIRDAVSCLNRRSGVECARHVDAVHFYGAGLMGPAAGLQQLFSEIFPAAEVEFCSDLMAAARAVCGREAGIAAILGTGSNSCLYDGVSVVRNVHSCGYVLGDFGGGAALGKEFLADYLQGLAPEAMSADFCREYGVDYSSAVASVYRGDAPAGYLASFAPYVLSVSSGKLDKECAAYASGLIKENFRRFFRRCIRQYDTDIYSVGIVGSFGFACRDILEEMASEEGVRISQFMASPMEGLVRYHGCRGL